MRPVVRGEIPKNKNGTDKVFSAYENARRDLIDRMGEYCSYCNMHLDSSLAVEHVQPKDSNPELKLSWDNFLLACTNCNSTKGKKDVNKKNIDTFFWADVHNTHIPFVYEPNGRVSINSKLTKDEKKKAQNTLDLVGLQKYPNTQNASDRRWKNRKEAYEQAIEHLEDLEQATLKGARELLIKTLVTAAYNKGFFSVWFEVYKDHDDVKKALIERFTGTCVECFDKDNHYNPIPRTSEM